jgi:hypothetical protein
VRKLNELAPSLKALGLEVITGIHTGTHRLISVNSVSGIKALDEIENDVTDATNVSSLSSSRHIEDAFVRTCFLCHRRLPDDLADCTYLEGKPVHCVCANKIEAQKKKPKCKHRKDVDESHFDCLYDGATYLKESHVCGSDCDGWEAS